MSASASQNNGFITLSNGMVIPRHVKAPKPPDMILTEQEEDWTWRLIQEIEGARLPKLPTEMEYAQQAMIARGDVQLAMDRVQGLQRFRDVYKVQDTVEEGMAVLEQFLRMQPGLLLSVGQPLPGLGSLIWNYANFQPAKAFASPQAWRVHVVGYYYLMQLIQPTLDAVRIGVTILVETKDMDWENFDLDFATQLREEVGKYYPIDVLQVTAFNTNSVANMAYSLCKPILDKELQRRVTLGCQVEIDAEFPIFPKLSFGDLHQHLQPNTQDAINDILGRLRELLTLRHEREAIFEM